MVTVGQGGAHRCRRHVTLTITRIAMDEVEFMHEYADTVKHIENQGDVRECMLKMMHLIGSLNDRVTELQIEDPDD